MKAKTYRDSSELAYGDFDNLATFLRTHVFAEEESAQRWRATARKYARSNPDHTVAVVDDLNHLLADPRATDEQVTRWIRVRTGSEDGRLQPGVPVRHSLLELRDLLYAESNEHQP